MILTPTEEFFYKFYRHRGHTLAIIEGTEQMEVFCASCLTTVLSTADFNEDWVSEAGEIMEPHILCDLRMDAYGTNNCRIAADTVSLTLSCCDCDETLFDVDRSLDEDTENAV